MERDQFENLVAKAADNLPDEFADLMENVEVVVEDIPGKSQVRKMRLRDPLQLLGLYEGIPQTERGTGYNLVLPDKITLFQKSIETACRYSGRSVQDEVEEVLKHEIAHHFGIGDGRLSEIDREKRRNQGRKPR
jgi:predicted Zn-dependent protease with MMP-like domain